MENFKKNKERTFLLGTLELIWRGWRESKSSGMLHRIDCSKCLSDNEDGGNMFLRNVGNPLPVDTALDHKNLETWTFLPTGIKFRSLPLRSSTMLHPLQRESNEAVWPDLYCATHCVCVGGEGNGEKAHNRREGICYTRKQTQNNSMQDQFASSLRPSTFLWWTSTRTELYLDRHTWKLWLWCSGLLSDCSILFFLLFCNQPSRARTPYNFDTTTNQEITLLF
jgi:hypothetical protein